MPDEIFDSADPNVTAVRATNSSDGGSGLSGEPPSGTGVAGFSTSSIGVDATTEGGPAAVRGTHTGDGGAGVLGIGPANGVLGRRAGDGQGFAGVFGEAIDGPGVSGSGTSSVGVDAKSENSPAALRPVHCGVGGPGVLGVSRANGVVGKSTGDGPWVCRRFRRGYRRAGCIREQHEFGRYGCQIGNRSSGTECRSRRWWRTWGARNQPSLWSMGEKHWRWPGVLRRNRVRHSMDLASPGPV